MVKEPRRGRRTRLVLLEAGGVAAVLVRRQAAWSVAAGCQWASVSCPAGCQWACQWMEGPVGSPVGKPSSRWCVRTDTYGGTGKGDDCWGGGWEGSCVGCFCLATPSQTYWGCITQADG